LILYAVAGSGVLGLAVVLGVILLAKGGKSTPKSIDAQLTAAGCTQTTYPLLEGKHVGSENAKVKWNSFPPTSGPHYYTPAPWNFYTDPINPRLTLHNLEHGGIDIFYGSKIPQSQINDLRSFWDQSPNALIVAPMPKPDANTIVPRPIPDYSNKIVLAAWTAKPYGTTRGAVTPGNGYLVSCGHFNEKAFAAFRDVHRGKGPERFPGGISQLTPGS
jgi:Protein of unknown function (DUF3105)